jgi:manganese/zinc/iron transport system substrate-binding protein
MLNFLRQITKNIIIIAGALFALCGCKEQASQSNKNQSAVLATTAMVADVVKNVGQEHVNVQTLMGPDVDPHLYKASPKDIYAMNKAQAIFYNGLHLEGKMADVLEKYSKKKTTCPLAQGVDPQKIIGKSETKSLSDPHIWMDVKLWSQTVLPVADKLSELDPVHKLDYQANAQKYVQQLNELDQECQKLIAKLPKEKRILITAHDAFKYFGKSYGFTVLGVQGMSTESEAGLKEINQLVDTIVKNKIGAVFVETSVSPKNIEALIEGAKSKGVDVKIGGKLYSDAMGKPDTEQGTYVGMIRHNVKTIVEGLLKGSN